MLHDGTTVELKIAEKGDYERGGYEYLYTWLSDVDHFLAKRYAPNDVEEHKKRWLDSVDNDKITVLGLHDGKIVASASLNLSDHHSRSAHTASFGVAVHPAFQKKGLGTILVTTLEGIARDKGIKKIEVNYYEGNPAASLYHALGYQQEGRRTKKGRLDDGTYVDEILLYKFIDGRLEH
ncbi:MAG: GNAT family N-acetyltransferase [Euryarchaeota archaeon]|nr:GNAT family N-acetyltransferase [Euryarchaeota archaeon]